MRKISEELGDVYKKLITVKNLFNYGLNHLTQEHVRSFVLYVAKSAIFELDFNWFLTVSQR